MNSVMEYVTATVLAIGVVGCATHKTITAPCDDVAGFPDDLSLSAEMDSVRQEAVDVFGLNIDDVIKSGSDRNFVGLATRTTRLSRRIDSLTYLIQDDGFGLGRPHGFYDGSDTTLKRVGRELLDRLDRGEAEIDEETVLTERVQVGQHVKGKVVMEPPNQGPKTLRVSRKVAGLPVFSSKLALSLTANKRIGHLELHWPDIPRWVVLEAKRLDALVTSGWKPPKRKGATPESVQAGIIHSPAIGFAMDIYPAIRVIYSSQDETLGRKLMEYYDRHGEMVATPRIFTKDDEALTQQWGKKRDSQPTLR